MTKRWRGAGGKHPTVWKILNEFLLTSSSKQNGALGGLLGPFPKPILKDAIKVTGKMEHKGCEKLQERPKVARDR